MTTKQIDWNGELETMAGDEVRFLGHQDNGLIALAFNSPTGWRIRILDHKGKNPVGNILVRNKPKKVEGWLNINFEGLPAACTLHETKEIADQWGRPRRQACIKISYIEGEGV